MTKEIGQLIWLTEGFYQKYKFLWILIDVFMFHIKQQGYVSFNHLYYIHYLVKKVTTCMSLSK